MARMPSGQPVTVPDPAGDQYDEAMAQLRAQREAEDRGDNNPVEGVGRAWTKFRNGPRIPRPSTAESFIPAVGPAWEAAGDLQDGNYGAAAFNGAMAVAEALPIGTAFKGLNALRKGVTVLNDGSVTANAASKALRKLGVAGAGEEIHHSIPLNGMGRTVEDWRNHYAFLKVLPKEQHRRLTGSWAGKPMYDPVRRIWYGTTDWMKTIPAGVAGWTADALQNATGDDLPPNLESNPAGR